MTQIPNHNGKRIEQVDMVFLLEGRPVKTTKMTPAYDLTGHIRTGEEITRFGGPKSSIRLAIRGEGYTSHWLLSAKGQDGHTWQQID